MAKVDIDQSKQLQGLLNVCGADLQLERTSEYDIRDAESSQAFAEKARAIAAERVCPRYDGVDSRRRQKFAEVLNQLNQPAGDLEELDTATGDGDGRRLVQEWRCGRQTLELNSQSLAAKKTMPSVYVGNLPLSVTKRELAGLFSACGEVHDVWLATRRPDMEHTYAFVRFYNPESCVLACESMRGVEVRGRALRVNIADEPIQDRSHKDTLIRQDPVGRYYPKTENSEEKKLVWALRQSCSTFHSQHVLYANQFFLQLKDPQPGAGFCANRLVVDFDEVLSWLEDIPEDLAPAVGDEGPAYTLQGDGKDSRDAIPAMKKSNSETNSLVFASVMTSQGSSKGNDNITTNGPDSTESNIEQDREPFISKKASTTTTNANILSPDFGANLASLSFKSPEKGNIYLQEPRGEMVHPPSERVPGTGQLSPLTHLSPPTTANANVMPPASDSTLASLSFKSPEKGNTYLQEPRGERVHPPTDSMPGTGQLSPLALLSPPTTANAKIMSPASDSTLASLSPEKGNTYLHEQVGPLGERVHPSTGTGQLSPLALLSPPSGRPIKRMSPSSRRHYRSPRSLYPVPGAPYPTMPSTTVPAAFPSSMFDQQDDGPVTNCPVGELVKLDEDPPNDVQLIDLDQKQSDAKTSSSHTRELVALFEGNDASIQEHKDELLVQPSKSNLQLLEELFGGCEVCSSNDVVEGDTVEHELV